MILKLVTVALVLGGLLTACGKHYWQSRDRGVRSFRSTAVSVFKRRRASTTPFPKLSIARV